MTPPSSGPRGPTGSVADSATDRFPNVARYLALLPNGLESYPECLVRSTTFDELLTPDRKLLSETGSDDERIQRILSISPRRGWIPEVCLLAGFLAVFDQRKIALPEHFSIIRERTALLYRSMVYRALMSFISPDALISVASARWSSFHQGTELVVSRIGQNRLLAELRFPPHLFNGPTAYMFGGIFAAAIDCARCRSNDVQLQDVEATSARYTVSWT